jgi:hypothetical protein
MKNTTQKSARFSPRFLHVGHCNKPLTPWSRVLEKPTAAQALINSEHFMKPDTRAHHMSLSWARWIQSILRTLWGLLHTLLAAGMPTVPSRHACMTDLWRSRSEWQFIFALLFHEIYSGDCAVQPCEYIVTWLTIDRVWVGNWIYWTLTERNYK